MSELERLASLEVEYENLKDEVGGMNEKLDILIANMNKSEGFWAGVVAAGTALGAALGATTGYILHSKLN